MTLSQLRAFALVARLGSLKAAAAALGISEPAVSSALASLRTDLGDRLYVRAGSGIALTPGGRALAEHAQEIVGLADRARQEVAEASTPAGRVHVLVTASFEEHAAGPLLEAFRVQIPGAQVEVAVRPADTVAAALRERSCDIALGARPSAVEGGGMHVVPFLRYERVLVAAPTHPLAQLRGPAVASALMSHEWFTGPAGIEPSTEEGRWLASLQRLPDLVALPSEREALAAVKAGEGVMLALGRVVAPDLRHRTLVQLAVSGTPVTGLWAASTSSQGRVLPLARALQRFVTTPEATAAVVAFGSPHTARSR
ncbi:MAG TPA: LysR family transcriptional regulator [Mycobacteriales bacterium]|jgi:DNA-binding transcriptional LysR family regulator|nr:LysR family transcriptional regulator [Mycobacteriales bacterium]